MKIEKIKEIIENLDIENPSEEDIEAIEEAIRTGETTEQEIRERNERMSNRAHKTVNTINKPIERGIDVDNDIASIIVDRFKVGDMVEIPEEKGHGSSGFSISNKLFNVDYSYIISRDDLPFENSYNISIEFDISELRSRSKNFYP